MFELILKSKLFASASALLILMFYPALTASAQFSLHKQSRAIFSGQLVDAKTGEPLSEATVIIRTQYGEEKTKTDSAGNFLLEVEDAKDLENFLIVFSHPDYREKDINTLFNSVFRGKARLNLQGGSAKFKYKKDDIALSCGAKQSLTAKGGQVGVEFECQPGMRTLSLRLTRGNVFSVSGSGDIKVEIDEKRAEIVYSDGEPARIDVKAMMHKR